MEPHGKQVLNPQGIYYTLCSGIWQTIGWRTCPDNFISSLRITNDIDSKSVDLILQAAQGQSVDISILDNGKIKMTTKATAIKLIQLPIFNPKLWSPAHPFLYDLLINIGKNKVQSFFLVRARSLLKNMPRVLTVLS